MAKKTQGTDLYVVDPDDFSLITVGCVTSIDGIDTSVEQVETTCLGDSARSYIAGLATPGTASFGLNTDLEEESHARLHALKIAGTTLNWAVGWSESSTPPTVDTDGEFVLGTDRSWITFSGFMNSFPFSFQQNSVVQSTIGIQVSGEPVAVAKSA